MTDVLPGQLDMLDQLEGDPPPLTSPRIFCEFCRSNWGHGLKPEVLARLSEEHAAAVNGQSTDIAAKGIAEPYYAPGETPWLSGSVIQYPRPKGCGGLYRLRQEGVMIMRSGQP